ncbi:helix-turn-helix domain-containing protein [Streptomyces sp. NPDC001478]
MRIRCLVCADGPSAGHQQGKQRTPLTRVPLRHLTPTERQVFAALYSGPSNEELAARLHITPRTVKFHIVNLRTKLGGLTRLRLHLLAALERLELPAVCPACAHVLAEQPRLAPCA